MRERLLATVLAVASLLVLGGKAQAQVAGDFPTYKGSPARTGSNGDPANNGSGDTALRWYLLGTQTPRIVDNFPYGTVTGNDTYTNKATGTWTAPTVDQEARNPYLIVSGGAVYRPAYLWTPTTASATGTDPTAAANAADLRTFDWIYNPIAGSRDYAVSVWLPSGPTIRADGTYVYPQQKFVYEVFLGPVSVLVDVVDSSQGGGWVRLGNNQGKAPFVVHADGTLPITVRLYNTVPRDGAGNLILPSNTSATSLAVYADAVEFVPTAQAGSYTAGPVMSTFAKRDSTSTIRVVAARNNISQSNVAGGTTQIQQGILTSYLYNGAAAAGPPYNQNTAFWSFAPIATSSSTTAMDNIAATTTGTAFASSTVTGRYTGADYEAATALIPAKAGDPAPTPTSDVRYAPTLADGDYEVWAYLSGDLSPSFFAHYAQYEIHEGATISYATVDQSQTGWVKVGTRRYLNSEAAPLEVRVTNTSSNISDNNKLVYADAIRFIGAADLAVTSTPVQATVRIRKTDGTVAETPIDLVADERGVIHCLDAEGKGDGTTTEYWSYPSTPDRGDPNWVDPNVKEGIDGVYKSGAPAGEQVITAVMPTGFDLSSALIERIDGEDYLYIASRNGRVYCIAMQGRGDYDKTQTGSSTILPGTAKRAWTFPSDPKDDPARGVTNSSLGSFVGSVVFGTTGGEPTIFVPAPQGRLYALDARSSTTTPRTTAVRWAYPKVDKPTLGAIVSTPVFDYGKVFFGTLRKDDTQNGQFVAVNADTGALSWSASSLAWDKLIGATQTQHYSTDLSDFRCSPVTVHGSVVGDTFDYVYTLNDNGYLYALSPVDGSVIGTGTANPWAINERTTTCRTTLGFTYVSTTVQGTFGVVPVVTVPTVAGRWLAFLAKQSQVTKYGTRYVMSLNARNGEALTPSAFGDNWLYFGDNGGSFYAFAPSSSTGTTVDPSDVNVPIDQTQGDEDVRNIQYNKTYFRLITREAYRRLQGLASSTPLTYKQVDSGTYDLPGSTPPNTPAFDWGETVYMIIYRFPYDTTQSIPNFAINLTVDGQTTRTIPANTLQFQTIGAGDPPRYNDLPGDQVTANPLLNGYAVAQFTFQAAGQNALPPGPGRFDLTVTSVPVTAGAGAFQIDLPAGIGFGFNVANPLGLAVTNDSIGRSIYPTDPENLVNGSPDIAGATTFKSRLASSTGKIVDGNAGSTTVNVYDRSLMTLLRPGQVGIDNVRVQVRDLGWEGGEAAIFKPFDSTLYPEFEDKPSAYPNTSKDYPDIAREQIKVRKGVNGSTENPVGFNTSLLPPTFPTTSGLDPDPTTRTLVPTPFTFSVDVPRYQPPNTVERLQSIGSAVQDSRSGFPDQGYLARIAVFVDSVQNGVLDSVQAKEAYRAFNLFTSVAPSERLSVITPNVDLGSLAGGTGYSPLWPAAGGAFDPWTGAWKDVYKPFTVRNEGNMNLFDVRLATQENVSTNGGAYTPFGFVASTSDPLAWLDASMDLYSDLNGPFAPLNPNWTSTDPAPKNAVILPKARPDDRVGTELSVNPVRRANPNTGRTGFRPDGLVDSLVDPTIYPPGPPRVGVSVPLGFPAGKYSQNMAVVENFRTSTGAYDSFDPAWSLYPEGPTPYGTDLVVSFNVRESRITTTSTPHVAPVIDDFSTASTTQAFPYSNLQPAALRDASGGLLFAWTSNRPTLNPTPQIPDTPASGDAWRIYFAGIGNATKFTSTDYSTPAGQTPIRDLNQFTPDSANGRWMHPLGPATGYPDATLSTLQTMFGANVVANTGRFGSPAFPSSGIVNPYLSSSNSSRLMGSTYLAFVGDAQTNTASGRATVSKVFLTPVTTGSNGNMTLGTAVPVPGDVSTAKGKPSVVVAAGTNGTATGAVVFYSAIGGGTSGLYYSYYDAAGAQFTPETPLNVGSAFETVSSPNGVGRAYTGVGQSYGNRVIELSFAGKLKGRPTSEVFLGRLLLDDVGAPITTANPFAYLPPQTLEPLASGGRSTYYARGVAWNREYPMQLVEVINGTPTDVLMNGMVNGTYTPSADTKSFDRASGIISYSSRLGGKVYLDPNSGTIRFSAGGLPASATLYLTYQPRFVRISAGDAGSMFGYTNPTLLYDQHYISDENFWRTASNAAPASGAAITNDRFVVTYGRSAPTGGEATQPLISTMRFGLRLPAPIATSNGSVVGLTVTGAKGPYQVDVATQSVYFSAADEDNAVTVNYTAVVGADPSNQVAASQSGVVGLIQEIAPYKVPIDQSFNEANLTAFLDPFTYVSTSMRRPPLIWMFWSSTRAGNPDVFFQTIAPQWNPIVGK